MVEQETWRMTLTEVLNRSQHTHCNSTLIKHMADDSDNSGSNNNKETGFRLPASTVKHAIKIKPSNPEAKSVLKQPIATNVKIKLKSAEPPKTQLGKRLHSDLPHSTPLTAPSTTSMHHKRPRLISTISHTPPIDSESAKIPNLHGNNNDTNTPSVDDLLLSSMTINTKSLNNHLLGDVENVKPCLSHSDYFAYGRAVDELEARIFRLDRDHFVVQGWDKDEMLATVRNWLKFYYM